MEPAHRELSQADFAREMGVSRAAVSQWKSKDILRDDAFTKPGKKGLIIFPVAVEQVRRNRDIGQALGNGLVTRTSIEVAPVQAEGVPEILAAPADPVQQVEAAPAAAPRPNSIEDQIKQAKLEAQLRQNRLEAANEAAKQGRLISIDDARKQMAQIAQTELSIFDGALSEFADALAAQFGLPQRDALHLLRSEFQRIRKAAATRERARLDGMAKTVVTNVEPEAEC